jgi:hypothetical protein
MQPPCTDDASLELVKPFTGQTNNRRGTLDLVPCHQCRFSMTTSLSTQATGGAEATPSAGHRQYRYYCTHVLILLHNNDSLASIHLHSFGSRYDSPKESFLSLSLECLCLNPFLVSACDLHSGNPDECQYPGDDARDASLHAPISLGASGLQGDSRFGPFEPCRFLDALIEAADVLFSRCAVLISSSFDVALPFFTRCPLAWAPDSLLTRCAGSASGEGRFA